MNLSKITHKSKQKVPILLLDNEAAEIDKKTVLDLCAHMFHPKDSSHDRSDNS